MKTPTLSRHDSFRDIPLVPSTPVVPGVDTPRPPLPEPPEPDLSFESEAEPAGFSRIRILHSGPNLLKTSSVIRAITGHTLFQCRQLLAALPVILPVKIPASKILDVENQFEAAGADVEILDVVEGTDTEEVDPKPGWKEWRPDPARVHLQTYWEEQNDDVLRRWSSAPAHHNTLITEIRKWIHPFSKKQRWCLTRAIARHFAEAEIRDRAVETRRPLPSVPKVSSMGDALWTLEQILDTMNPGEALTVGGFAQLLAKAQHTANNATTPGQEPGHDAGWGGRMEWINDEADDDDNGYDQEY